MSRFSPLPDRTPDPPAVSGRQPIRALELFRPAALSGRRRLRPEPRPRVPAGLLVVGAAVFATTVVALVIGGGWLVALIRP